MRTIHINRLDLERLVSLSVMHIVDGVGWMKRIKSMRGARRRREALIAVAIAKVTDFVHVNPQSVVRNLLKKIADLLLPPCSRIHTEPVGERREAGPNFAMKFTPSCGVRALNKHAVLAALRVRQIRARIRNARVDLRTIYGFKMNLDETQSGQQRKRSCVQSPHAAAL